MRVVILQPGYIPWLGFFEQLQRADVFVIYDDVQFDRRGWRNRNRIKGPDGQVWLTVPVVQKGHFGERVCSVHIDNQQAWKRKHIESLRRFYARAPFFKRYFEPLAETIKKSHEKLIDLDISLIYLLAQWIGEPPAKFRRSSEMAIEGGRTSRLLNICKALGADKYYTGAAAKNYFESNLFDDAGIRVEFQNYRHPVYPQLFGEFIPYLSIVDLLFNKGEEAAEIIASGCRDNSG
jgi:hypothetical protein